MIIKKRRVILMGNDAEGFVNRSFEARNHIIHHSDRPSLKAKYNYIDIDRAFLEMEKRYGRFISSLSGSNGRRIETIEEFMERFGEVLIAESEPESAVYCPDDIFRTFKEIVWQIEGEFLGLLAKKENRPVTTMGEFKKYFKEVLESITP